MRGRDAQAYPAGSFLAHLVESHGEALAALKSDTARSEWIEAHLKALPAEKRPGSPVSIWA